jgi:hypothetical protein
MEKKENPNKDLEKKDEKLIYNKFNKYDIYMCDNDSVYIPIDLENLKVKNKA